MPNKIQSDPIQFQLLDIGDDDHDFNYVVTLYGKDKEDENIVCHIKGFKPSFYVRVPEDNKIEFKKIIKNSLELFFTEEIKNKKNNKNINDEDLEVELDKKMYFYTDLNCPYYCGMKYSKNIVKEKSFYNFSFKDDETFSFYELSFKSNFSMMKYINAIKSYYNYCLEHFEEKTKDNEYLKKWLLLKENNCECEANLYESNISPILKFIHKTNIKSCGWIEINDPKMKILEKVKKDKMTFKCHKEYYVHYSDKIKSIDNDKISDFVICSFDIECDSSHGDFPNPKKDFKRLATEIYEYILRDRFPGTQKSPAGRKIIIEKIIECAFDDNYDENPLNVDISTIDTNEAYNNLDEVLDKFEASEIFNNMNEFNDPKNRNNCIKEINKILSDLKHIDDKGIKTPIIVKGDPIIQIGNVFYNYKTKDWNRVIVVFKDNVDKKDICPKLNTKEKPYGIKVFTRKTEKKLLLKWVKVMNKYNPDFITGYNIFGFDFNYISERVDVLFPCPDGCETKTFDYGNKSRTYKEHCPACPKKNFYKIGKILKNDEYKYRNKMCQSENKELSSSGLGDNELKFIHMDGRILFDMMKEVMKGHALESYKLDNVASHFMKGKVKIKRANMYSGNSKIKIYKLNTKNIGNLKIGDYIVLNVHTKWGSYNYEDKKFKIIVIYKLNIYIESKSEIDIKEYEYIEWCLAKDDISPQDIFDKHKYGNSDDRALIAKYCIMDCELCIHLMLLLDIIPNNIGMANVCSVPLSYIFLRGQGVKVNSLVTKECNKQGIKIPTLKAYDPNNKEGFEGAIVLDPEERKTTGMYLEDPIAVVDYASLYPSSIIENNFSHETFICTKKDYEENPEKYDNFREDKNYYTCATYDDYEFTEKFKKDDEVNIRGTDINAKVLKVEKSKDENDDTKYYILKDQENKFSGEKLTKIEDKKWDKNKLDTQTTCYFKSQFYNYKEEDGPKYGIIPIILKTLLDARSATKKLLKETENEDKKKVLDGLQLAYKVTANSVYGQMGAKTSSIFFKKIAACTTAIGRQRIYDAEKGTQEWAKSPENILICKNEDIVKQEDRAIIIYGDTDSVFIKFSRYNTKGELLKGEEAITHCIKCGEAAGDYVTKKLNPEYKDDNDDDNLRKYLNKEKKIYEELEGPQKLEYEKTFANFILISKKRYIGDKHEKVFLEDPKRISMGIVMKRRDNAPIVKYVYGNILEILMKQKDLEKAKKWLEDKLKEIVNGEMSKDNIDMFVITKSLKGYYKNPKSIAHKVLADRIAERDPGNRPKPNDRIPYAYIKVNDKPIRTGKYEKKEIKEKTGKYEKIEKEVETGKYEKIEKEVETGKYEKKEIKKKTGKYEKIEKKVENGFKKNGEIKYKKIKEDDKSQPKYKTIKVDDKSQPKYKTIKVDDITKPKYIKKKILQGNRIEHRDYINDEKNKVDLDFNFYISNQIMKPVKQLLEIQLKKEDIDEIFNEFIKD